MVLGSGLDVREHPRPNGVRQTPDRARNRMLGLEAEPVTDLRERDPVVAGVGAAVVSRYGLTPADTIFVFSNSGVNAVPVEVALTAKEAGATGWMVKPFDPQRLLDVVKKVLG